MDWEKNEKVELLNTPESKIFKGTQKLIQIRKQLPVISDQKNLTWMAPHNIHVAGFLRAFGDKKVYCVFNFSNETAFLTWYAFKEQGTTPGKLFDHWTGAEFIVGPDNEYLIIPAYGFLILEVIS